MELVDIYDAWGRPTGVVRPRGEPLQEGEYLLAVGIWIVDEDNNILLTQRSGEKRWAPGKWENTAGHVQAGETCVAAILRELKEETGIVATEDQLLSLGSAKAGQYFGENYGLRLKEHPEHLSLRQGETCDAKWVTPEELDDMARQGELSPSVISHLEGGCRSAFLKLIGREGSTLLGKDEAP